MPLRAARPTLLSLVLLMTTAPTLADSSSRELASYYDRHMALVDGVAYGWLGRGEPRRQRDGVVQVGVSRDAYFALLADARLLSWADNAGPHSVLMAGVARFATGASGWFAVDTAGVLWFGTGNAKAQRVADEVVDACIGDSADYFITCDARLHVKGLAHRGQYGDGKLAGTEHFVVTASDAATVKAHTGHAIHLKRDGSVWGTGGNRFGPLSAHGLGDKADRWGAILEGASAIATGSRHSVAIRPDGSLWAWGEGFTMQPAKVMDQVGTVAAGNTATIARRTDGTLWQWDSGGTPRRLRLRD